MSPLSWLVPLLRCPECYAPLEFRADIDDAEQGLLEHASGPCDERYPVIDAIPRLLRGGHRARLAQARAAWFDVTPDRRTLARRWTAETGPSDPLVTAFDDEWARFSAVQTPELSATFARYFDTVPMTWFSAEQTVLDAGCGSGRWACEVAARGPRVVAVDLGFSVELALRNAHGNDRIGCVQLDLRDLPLARGSFDWAYSLGVLHHLDRPELALQRIVDTVRPGGLVLAYLYYALDGRGFGFRALFRAVDLMRRVTSRLPRPAVVAFSRLVAVAVYWPLARLSAILARAGAKWLADILPLSFYRDLPLSVMANDSLDRFGTRVELRFTRPAMERLLLGAGLDEIRFSDQPPYWHATATARR